MSTNEYLAAEQLDYSVWSEHADWIMADNAPCSSVFGRFRFLQEAIDFACYASTSNRGGRAVLRGPWGMASIYRDGSLALRQDGV